MRYFFEKYGPLLTSLSLSSLVYFYAVIDKSGNSYPIDKLMDSSLRINTVLIGFFLTIFTAIQSIETRRMKWVKDAGIFERIIKYLKNSIAWQFISITIILVVPFVDFVPLNSWQLRLAYTVQFFIIMFTWGVSIRFARIFIKILSDPQKVG